MPVRLPRRTASRPSLLGSSVPETYVTRRSAGFRLASATRSARFVEDLIALPIALALAPAMAAAFASAWEAPSDVYIVTGRWTWDAGHAGHTEFHPVKTIQRLEPGEVQSLFSARDPRQPLPQVVIDAVNDVRGRWCRHVLEAPPPGDPRGDGNLTPPQIGALTPEQLGVYTRQLQPEKAWIVHAPVQDLGCAAPGYAHEAPVSTRIAWAAGAI